MPDVAIVTLLSIGVGDLQHSKGNILVKNNSNIFLQNKVIII